MTRARDVANLIGSGNYSSTTFTATAGQTAFSISHTQGFVQVFMNGLLLDLTTDYTSNGSAITLTSGAAAGDEIEVVKYNTFSVGDAVAASGGTFTGNVAMSGTLGVTGATTLTGNTTVGGTFGSTGLITASGGVAIGGTGADNTLDDYETGTYTPTYLATGSSGSNSYSYQTGTYTKVGRLVRVWIDMNITSSSGMSGTPAVSLPFASAASTADMGSMVPWVIANNFTGSKSATGWIDFNKDVIYMYVWSGDTNAGHTTWALNTTGRIAFGLMYTV